MCFVCDCVYFVLHRLFFYLVLINIVIGHRSDGPSPFSGKAKSGDPFLVETSKGNHFPYAVVASEAEAAASSSSSSSASLSSSSRAMVFISSASSSSSSSHTSSLAGGPSRHIQRHLRESLTTLNQLRMFEERATPKNVTAQIGHPVYLHCIVEPIGDKMVSWIRLRDFHLLTVGLFTYTSDYRFVVRHGTLTANDWALQIKHVTPKDEGLYECQVNTDPPRSIYYYLHVVVPQAGLAGAPDDMFVRAGAIINLTCVISNSPDPPAFVFWYHNDRMINYDYNSRGRGEISVQKDPEKSDTVISRLVIRGARLNDSGNYTCTPSNAEPTSIYVHVLQGEKRLSNHIQSDEAGSTEFANSGSVKYHPHLNSCRKCLNLTLLLFGSILFQLSLNKR